MGLNQNQIFLLKFIPNYNYPNHDVSPQISWILDAKEFPCQRSPTLKFKLTQDGAGISTHM